MEVEVDGLVDRQRERHEDERDDERCRKSPSSTAPYAVPRERDDADTHGYHETCEADVQVFDVGRHLRMGDCEFGRRHAVEFAYAEFES